MLVTRSLPVALTEDELRQKGDALAQLHQDRIDLDAEEKTVKEGFKGRRASIEERAATLAREIRTKSESRDVEVHERKDRDRYVVELFRIDTGEVIETRGMTLAERQETLPFPAEVGEDGKPTKRSKAGSESA